MTNLSSSKIITINHLEEIHDRTTDSELNKRFAFSPEFPVFIKIYDLAESSPSISFHGGNCYLEILVMKLLSFLGDFYIIHFCRSIYSCIYSLCLTCLLQLLRRPLAKSLPQMLEIVGLRPTTSVSVLNISAPQNFAAPRAPAGGAAFWRPAPCPERPSAPTNPGLCKTSSACVTRCVEQEVRNQGKLSRIGAVHTKQRLLLFRTKECGPMLQRCHQRHGMRCM